MTSNIQNVISINFVGFLYKLNAKVLAKRMTKMVGEVVKECKQNFVWREIFNTALIANEMVDEILSKDRNGFYANLT